MDTIYESLDYRKFLKELIAERQKQDSWFSYRWISSKIGVTSSGFLSLVLNGKRNISIENAARLCSVVKFTKKETEYFIALVRFNQAVDPQERTLAFESLIKLRPSSVQSTIIDQQEYYSHWYNAVVREMLAIMGDTTDADAIISETIIPKIAKTEVAASIALLERLGFVRKKADNTFEYVNALLTSAGSKIDSTVLKRYHNEMISLAEKALHTVNKEERDISTVTLSTDRDGIELIKKRIEQCRADIMAIAKQTIKADRVLQLNIQMFPLCKRLGEP
jgi:uncharacterized protein (TIGR02147 family)